MRGCAQRMMWKAQVLAPSNETHSRFSRFHALDRMTTRACERRKTLTHRCVQSLKKRGLERFASDGPLEPFLCVRPCPSRDLSRSFSHPFLFCALPHGSTTPIRPRVHTASPSPCVLLHLLSMRVRCGVDRPHTHRCTRAERARTDRTHVLEETVTAPAVSTRAHHSCHPEARRDIHCQSDPDDPCSSFGAHVLCLDLLTRDLSVFHTGMMNPLTRLSCPCLPRCSCPFIQARGMHDRWCRTSRSHEGHHCCDPVLICPPSLHHRASACAHGLFAPPAARALGVRRVQTNGVRSGLASCATRLIRAPVFRRVQWLCCPLFPTHIMPRTVLFFKPLPQCHR